MPSGFHIDVDLGALAPLGSPLSAGMFPNLSAATGRVAMKAQALWKAYAAGAPLPSGRSITARTGEYGRSILIRELGPYKSEVYSDLPYAKEIEEGSPAFDMKKMLDTSLKVRLTKDGRRYLIIPFRHFTPGAVGGQTMPQSVHDWWKEAQSSRVSGTFRRTTTHFRDPATGKTYGVHDLKTHRRLSVAGRKYVWGSRLGADDLAGLGVTGSAAKRMEGMVRFRPGASAGVTPGAHSRFITFRTMVEGGKGWIRPAQAGYWPARTVAQLIQPVAEQIFAAAIEADVRALLTE